MWDLTPQIDEEQCFTRVYRGRGELIDYLMVSHALTEAVESVTTGGLETTWRPRITGRSSRRPTWGERLRPSASRAVGTSDCRLFHRQRIWPSATTVEVIDTGQDHLVEHEATPPHSRPPHPGRGRSHLHSAQDDCARDQLMTGRSSQPFVRPAGTGRAQSGSESAPSSLFTSAAATLSHRGRGGIAATAAAPRA